MLGLYLSDTLGKEKPVVCLQSPSAKNKLSLALRTFIIPKTLAAEAHLIQSSYRWAKAFHLCQCLQEMSNVYLFHRLEVLPPT